MLHCQFIGQWIRHRSSFFHYGSAETLEQVDAYPVFCQDGKSTPPVPGMLAAPRRGFRGTLHVLRNPPGELAYTSAEVLYRMRLEVVSGGSLQLSPEARCFASDYLIRANFALKKVGANLGKTASRESPGSMGSAYFA